MLWSKTKQIRKTSSIGVIKQSNVRNVVAKTKLKTVKHEVTIFFGNSHHVRDSRAKSSGMITKLYRADGTIQSTLH